MKLEKWFTQKLEEFKDDVEFRTEEVILDITEKIVELMEEEGVNRTELAKRLGVSKPFITKLLNGNPNMRLKTMVSIAKALDYDLKVSFSRQASVDSAKKNRELKKEFTVSTLIWPQMTTRYFDWTNPGEITGRGSSSNETLGNRLEMLETQVKFLEKSTQFIGLKLSTERDFNKTEGESPSDHERSSRLSLVA